MRNWLSRAGLSLALAATLTGPVSAQPGSAPSVGPGGAPPHAGRSPSGTAPRTHPDAPSGLLANVYSRTAAGLRWERRDAPGERYEVRRDGERVAITDGTSHIALDLSPERAYLFEVIAVDEAGRRSPAARLMVRTTSVPRTRQVVAGPAVPDGLRAVAYSPTAGGISWRRPGSIGLRYEVRRDGRVLATTDGTSHVDTDLAEGGSYAYAVTAIDRAGRRSVEARITLDTPAPGLARLADVERPDPDAASVYARLGAARTVALARHWLDGPPFALLGAAQSVIEQLLSELRTTIAYPDEGTPYALSCPDGGRAEARTGYPYSRLTLLDCRAAGLQLSGEASRFAYGGAPLGIDETVGFTYDALHVLDLESGASVRATGREERTLAPPSDSSCRHDEPTETVSRELIDTAYVVDGVETRYERYEATPPNGRTSSGTDTPDDADDRPCAATRDADGPVSARVSSPSVDGRSVGLRAGSSRGALPLVVRFDDGTILRLDRQDGGGDLQLDIDGDGTARSYVLRDD